MDRLSYFRAKVTTLRHICMKTLPIEDYFNNLKEDLKVEWQAEQEAFSRLLNQRSLRDRIEEGISWFPARARHEMYHRHAWLSVWIEREKNLDLPHLFSKGCLLKLSAGNGKSAFEIKGIAGRVESNGLEFCYLGRELPEAIFEEDWVLDLQPDETSYKAMLNGLETVKKERNSPLADLVQSWIRGTRHDEREPVRAQAHPELNAGQQEAIQLALNQQDFFFLHGPPGTGKTTTLAMLAWEMVRHNKTILATASSNAAADNLAAQLQKMGLDPVRIGHPIRMSEGVRSLSVDHRIQAHPRYSEVVDYQKRSRIARQEAEKYRRSFGEREREERATAKQEARMLQEEADAMEDFLRDSILEQARVVVATLISAQTALPSKLRFDMLMVDEAAQALEPAIWTALTRARKLCLAGDPFQLPPTLHAQTDLKTTLLEKGLSRFPGASCMLQTQYRMHPSIMEFPSRHFYGNALLAGKGVPLNAEFGAPVEFMDTAGTGYDEAPGKYGKSYHNLGERELIRRWLEKQDCPEDLVFLSPYRGQVDLANQETWPGSRPWSSIDAFQGQEADMVVVSLVRSNPQQEYGFLADSRRLNVAFTRARKKLLVVGDSATWGSDAFFSAWLTWVESQGGYKSAWDYLY